MDSLYHYVNSPIGIFVQNALIIFWIFLYPSVVTILLLACSTLNMLFVKAHQIENEVLISSSGLSSYLRQNPTLYYLLLGGLTDFKGVNWFIWVFIFYMGWCGIVFHTCVESVMGR